ncbi:NADP-dependent oxidoreductase domain-containing protein [Ochromonadaceae sp. CCMP2298]|nr:NADP-dependent oxidoreductase domain-containing protein [Ochromonadaceae sp. CCMP2298]
MEYCNLGSSDLRVSKVCLGTMTWGQQNTPQEGVDQLQYAFSQGVNFLDTAEIYPVPTKSSTQGDTDRVVARWLKTQTRSEVVLASKVAGNSPQLTYMPGRGGAGTAVTAGQIRASTVTCPSNRYVTVCHHFLDRYVPLFGGGAYNASLEREAVGFEEQLQALEELVKEGKVRHLGLSNETPYGVMKFAQVAEKSGSSRMVSIQNSYSLLVRSDFENGLTEVCSARNENVGLLAYSPLAGGILTGGFNTHYSI